MEKVILTKEQADAIEGLKKGNGYKFMKTRVILNYYNDSPILDLTIEDLSKAFLNGYEVEPEYKKGDWVFDFDKKEVFQLNKEQERNLIYWGSGKPVRHATPSEVAEEKERRFWKKHGRGVREVRSGDIIHNVVLDELDEVMNTHKLEEGYNIVCFAEKRLDVKTNE